MPTSITTTNYNIGTTTNASKTESYAYDAWGNILSHTDALNNTTTYTYDPIFHAPSSETRMMDTNQIQKTEWVINSATGNVLTVSDGEQNTYRYQYDQLV